MVEIKKAQINDLVIISKLAHEIWPTAYGKILGNDQLEYMLDMLYSISSLEHQYKILKHHFILAFENKTSVGFASFSPHEDHTVYHLNKIYVLPDQQGKNIGGKMIRYISEKIKKDGATSLQLNVNRYNKALHFYEKLGFKIIRNEDIDIGSGYFMNDYVMELKL
ncbi:MAG TPA: GNAT family N-acetyltransferase [Hanamia sp.]|nr:GNAT family N-acetyltransferase [Hanamia sp.]